MLPAHDVTSDGFLFRISLFKTLPSSNAIDKMTQIRKWKERRAQMEGAMFQDIRCDGTRKKERWNKVNLH